MDPVGLILAIAVGTSIIGGYLFFSGILGKQKQSAELTARIVQPSDPFSDEALPFEEEEKVTRSSLADTCDGITQIILPLIGKNFQKEYEVTRKKISHAGISSANAASYYLAHQYFGSIIVALVSLPFLTTEAEGGLYYQDLFIGIILFFLGLFGHKLYLNNVTQKRKKELIRSFPDALDLLLVCVESGLALDAAFAKVCNELGSAHPTITGELNRTRMELSMMSDRAKALYAMGERTDIVAFKSLAAALIQAEKFGTSLADTLRVMADDYRQTRLLMAENKANRLPALMTIPLITMLLPAMFIIIMAPAIIGLVRQGGIFGGG